MKQTYLYFLIVLAIYPLLGCQKSSKPLAQLDNNSYITNFELLQKNTSNDTRIRITSPKAKLDQTNNIIEIVDSSIEIINKDGQDFKVKSGYSTINNMSNIINVFNNVTISFIDNKDYYITTNSFNWDLNTSIIDIDSPLNMNLDNTKILATNGLYNLDLNRFKIDNSIFNRTFYNSEGKITYQVEIKSDLANWLKNENSLVFKSNGKQVQTSIKFLTTK
ncbi:LPS export ABC transporter periplasmic protein LptC [Prochlorococcus marinus]|uniref:LPS export ABC transporter periplasmic protein LptC n=1 Tax=Prochlorococcus marinus TaxID=1219 RepID=UPI0022B46190|nr:LPS export ABC transporter periplasmic protein LptC [Prochlorococcus marinus]